MLWVGHQEERSRDGDDAPRIGNAMKKAAKKKASYHHESPGREVTEQDLIEELDEDLKDAWKKLKDFAGALGPQRIYASGNAIMFSRKHCYLFVRPRRSYLETCIFLPEPIESSEIRRSQSVSKTRFANLYKLVHEDQVDEPLTDWVREAYEVMPAAEEQGAPTAAPRR